MIRRGFLKAALAVLALPMMATAKAKPKGWTTIEIDEVFNSNVDLYVELGNDTSGKRHSGTWHMPSGRLMEVSWFGNSQLDIKGCVRIS